MMLQSLANFVFPVLLLLGTLIAAHRLIDLLQGNGGSVLAQPPDRDAPR